MTSREDALPPAESTVQYCDFTPQHVDGVLELHQAVFPVRYTRGVVLSFLDPGVTAVVALVSVPVDTALLVPVYQQRVVGFISGRVQARDDMHGYFLGEKQVCLCWCPAPPAA